MYSALLRVSQYAFLHVKPPLQLPNHFHLLLQIFGMLCQTICLPFQLFLLLEELSNITYSSSLTLTVVKNLVRLNQLNVSHFVIQRQLLLLRCPETPCRPSKGWPDKSAQDKTAQTKARRQMRAVTKARRTIARRTIARGNKSAHDKSASIVYIIKDKNWKHRMISQSSNLVVNTRKLMQITRHITMDFI